MRCGTISAFFNIVQKAVDRRFEQYVLDGLRKIRINVCCNKKKHSSVHFVKYTLKSRQLYP